VPLEGHESALSDAVDAECRSVGGLRSAIAHWFPALGRGG
jgi:hypothetical protein